MAKKKDKKADVAGIIHATKKLLRDMSTEDKFVSDPVPHLPKEFLGKDPAEDPQGIIGIPVLYTEEVRGYTNVMFGVVTRYIRDGANGSVVNLHVLPDGAEPRTVAHVPFERDRSKPGWRPIMLPTFEQGVS